MEAEPEIIEKPPTSGETVWDMQASSVLLDNTVRSPQSLQIDDNNKLYIGVSDGVYRMNLKKIANRKVFTESVINVNDLIKKHFSRETINIILKDFNQKARENQERNYTTASMLRYRFRISSIMESKLLMKSFKISPNGLLPGNEPILALLLNIDTLILMGRVPRSFMEHYTPLTNCDMLTQDQEDVLPIFFNTHCYTWIDYKDDQYRLVFFVVYYENTIEIWAFKYYTILNAEKHWEYKRLLKEEYNEASTVMTGTRLTAGKIEVLMNGPGGKVNNLTYEIGLNEDLAQITLRRLGLGVYQSNFKDINFIRVLPSHLTPDDTYVRFVYGAQNHCFIGSFEEEQSNDCAYSHNFPANLSEIVFYDNGIEFFFMDGANYNYDITNNEGKIHRKQGIYGIFGASYSSTQILKILIGPPNYFALRNTNMLVLSNVSEKSPYFDIIYQMSNKIINNLAKREGSNYRVYTTQKPLNFSDILMLFATNQVNYRQFLKAYFATYDESLLESKSKKKADLKELLKGINSEIVEKFALSPEVKNHVAQAILLNLLYFAPEFFKESVNRLLNKTLLGFYSSIVLWCQEEAKGNEAIMNALYVKRLRSYLKQEESKDGMEIETGEDVDMCPICEVKVTVKDTQCQNGHNVLRCVLSRKVIYFQEYFECKLCRHKYLNEAVENYSKQGLDLNFSCVLCSNLLKKV